jgi:hypothetical protein
MGTGTMLGKDGNVRSKLTKSMLKSNGFRSSQEAVSSFEPLLAKNAKNNTAQSFNRHIKKAVVKSSLNSKKLQSLYEEKRSFLTSNSFKKSSSKSRTRSKSRSKSKSKREGSRSKSKELSKVINRKYKSHRPRNGVEQGEGGERHQFLNFSFKDSSKKEKAGLKS